MTGATRRHTGLSLALAAVLATLGCSVAPDTATRSSLSSPPASASASRPPLTTTRPTATRTRRPDPPVDLRSAPAEAQRLVDAVDGDRLLGDVRTLAAGPRPNLGDTRATLAAAAHVEAQMRAAGLATTRQPVTDDDITLDIVSAEIAGQVCPRQVIVVLAHYDSVVGSAGADDNASGVAGMLELGRVLAGSRLPATILLAAVPFEEVGHLGSLALAERLVTRQRRPVVAAVSFDMIGFARNGPEIDGERGDELGLLGFAGSESLVYTMSAAARTWAPEARVLAGTAAEGTPYVGRSDHASFHALGVPAAMATDGAETRNDNYHRPSDRPATISPAFLRSSARALVAGVVALASLDTQAPAGADACSRALPALGPR